MKEKKNSTFNSPTFGVNELSAGEEEIESDRQKIGNMELKK